MLNDTNVMITTFLLMASFIAPAGNIFVHAGVMTGQMFANPLSAIICSSGGKGGSVRCLKRKKMCI